MNCDSERGVVMIQFAPNSSFAGAPQEDAAERRTRRDREREQRRGDILNAALTLFSQKGYDKTTMAEIAAASEFAVGTLYKFFKDKNDLYQALLAETVHDYETQLVGALTGPGSEMERLHSFIDIGSHLFVKHLPLARVYFSQTAAAFLFAAAGLEDESFLSYRRIVSALENVFRSGVEKGVFVNVDPSVLAMGLEGVHNGFLAALVRNPQAYSPEQIAEYTKRVFFGSVMKNG